MHGVARGRHNHARLHRLNDRLRTLGLDSVRTLTQAKRDKVRHKASEKERPITPEPVQKLQDPNRERFEAKKRAKEEQRKKRLAEKNARHAQNKAINPRGPQAS